MASTRALAEVCDKERPDWTPGAQDHPDRLASLRDVALSAPGLALAVLFVLALLIDRRWLRIGAAWLLALMAIALAAGLWHPDRITSFAIIEGCVATPVYAAAFFAFLAAVLFWIARKPLPREAG